MTPKILRVVYDLQFTPITYDFTNFLVWCDCVRQVNKYDALDVTIRADGFRTLTPKDHSVSLDEKQWRAKSVLLDSCEIFPAILSSRLTYDSSVLINESFDLPRKYNTKNPDHNGFHFHMSKLIGLNANGADPRVVKAPGHAQHLVNSTIEKDIITLTPRVSNHIKERNVDLNAWFQFYTYLLDKGHMVYVVPDFEDVFSAQSYTNYDWKVFLPATFDQRLRLALYSRALMNFSTNGGMGAMKLYSHVPYTITDLKNDYFTNMQVLTEQLLGFPVGDSPPWATERQRMVWEKSTFESLVKSYEHWKF